MTPVLALTILASTMPTPIGPLTILTADGRVCAGGFTDDVRQIGVFRGKLLRPLPIEMVEHLGPITDALTAYFEGDLKALDRIPVTVQGGAFQRLREESAAFIGGMAFDGYAIGGSLGTSKGDMDRVLDWSIPSLPDDKPRHMLGIGEPEDLFRSGKAALCVCEAPWIVRFQEAGSTVRDKFDVLPLPGAEKYVGRDGADAPGPAVQGR